MRKPWTIYVQALRLSTLRFPALNGRASSVSVEIRDCTVEHSTLETKMAVPAFAYFGLWGGGCHEINDLTRETLSLRHSGCRQTVIILDRCASPKESVEDRAARLGE